MQIHSKQLFAWLNQLARVPRTAANITMIPMSMADIAMQMSCLDS